MSAAQVVGLVSLGAVGLAVLVLGAASLGAAIAAGFRPRCPDRPAGEPEAGARLDPGQLADLMRQDRTARTGQPLGSWDGLRAVARGPLTARDLGASTSGPPLAPLSAPDPDLEGRRAR